MELSRDSFAADELVVIPPPVRPVVLKSGGPVMEVLEVIDDQALCRWAGDDGRVGTAVFSTACLYACVPFQDKSP